MGISVQCLSSSLICDLGKSISFALRNYSPAKLHHFQNDYSLLLLFLFCFCVIMIAKYKSRLRNMQSKLGARLGKMRDHFLIKIEDNILVFTQML